MIIQLQFVLGAGWGSRLIAWYGCGYGGYSHVDAIMSDGTLIGARSDRIGGKPSGVQSRPADYENWIKRTIVSLEVTPQQHAIGEQFLLSTIGSGYDKDDILSLILGRPYHASGHWICSWLMIAWLKQMGVFGDLPFYPQQITPNSLLLAVCVVGGKPITTMVHT